MREQLGRRHDWIHRLIGLVSKFGTGRVDVVDDRNRFLVARLNATLTVGGIRFDVAVRNVSGSGLCVVSDVPLTRSDVCLVALADGKPQSSIYRAEVRWITTTSNELHLIGLQILDGTDG